MENKYIWEEEEEKLKEEKKVKEEKAYKEKIQKNETKKLKQKKKRNKRIVKIFLFIFVLFILFFPIFKINKEQVKNNIYFESNMIKNDVGFKESFSIAEYVYRKAIVARKIDYLDKINIKYDMNSKNMLIYAQEFIPLYHDINGNSYYANEKRKVKKWDIDYSTPLIDGVTDEVKAEITDQLIDLSYDVRLQIKSIEPADESKYGLDVLKMSMYDGNTIYIYPYQISYKMNYYNQIVQILEENQQDAGNIYLYIGDYYEPYN